jgi:hypothetical protein
MKLARKWSSNRDPRLWLAAVAVSTTLLSAGCQPSPPAAPDNPAPKPAAKPVPSAPPKDLAASAPDVRGLKSNQPVSVGFDGCSCVCGGTTSKVTGDVFLFNDGKGTVNSVIVTLYAPDGASNYKKVASLAKLATNGNPKIYPFTLDATGLGLGAFPPAAKRPYILVADVNATDAQQQTTDMFASADLDIVDCKGDSDDNRKTAVQDIPASVTPTPTASFNRNDTGDQLTVALTGSASQDVAVAMTYFKASDMTPLVATVNTITIVAGTTSKSATIAGTDDLYSKNNGYVGGVIAVASYGGNSTSCSFSIQ